MSEKLEEAFEWVFCENRNWWIDISFQDGNDIAIWLKLSDEVSEDVDAIMDIESDWQTREHFNWDQLTYLQVASFLQMLEAISKEHEIDLFDLYRYFFFVKLQFVKWKKYLLNEPIWKNTDRSYYFDTEGMHIDYVP